MLYLHACINKQLELAAALNRCEIPAAKQGPAFNDDTWVCSCQGLVRVSGFGDVPSCDVTSRPVLHSGRCQSSVKFVVKVRPNVTAVSILTTWHC